MRIISQISFQFNLSAARESCRFVDKYFERVLIVF